MRTDVPATLGRSMQAAFAEVDGELASIDVIPAFMLDPEWAAVKVVGTIRGRGMWLQYPFDPYIASEMNAEPMTRYLVRELHDLANEATP